MKAFEKWFKKYNTFDLPDYKKDIAVDAWGAALKWILSKRYTAKGHGSYFMSNIVSTDDIEKELGE